MAKKDSTSGCSVNCVQLLQLDNTSACIPFSLDPSVFWEKLIRYACVRRVGVSTARSRKGYITQSRTVDQALDPPYDTTPVIYVGPATCIGCRHGE